MEQPFFVTLSTIAKFQGELRVTYLQVSSGTEQIITIRFENRAQAKEMLRKLEDLHKCISNFLKEGFDLSISDDQDWEKLDQLLRNLNGD